MGISLEKNESRIHWAWVVLGSSFITLFITYSIRIGAYSVLLPEIIKDFQITKAEAGMIKSAFSVTYLLFAPLMGWLTDRIGGSKVVSLSCLLLGGGTFLMGTAKNLAVSVICYCLVGIGAAATWVPIVTLLQKWFEEKKRGLALGILSPSYGIGYGLTGLVFPWIVFHYEWRVCWYILGVSGFLLFFLNGFLLKDQPERMGLFPWGQSIPREEKLTSSSRTKKTVEILKLKHFWIIGTSYLAMAYGTYAILDFIVTYGVLELKIPYSVASLFITIIAFSGVVGGILLMALSDTVGRKMSLVTLNLIMAASALLIILGGRQIPVLMAGAVIFGFPYGAIYPMYAACVRDYFPEGVAGTVLGLLTIFYGVGAMVSPVLTGHLADLTGTFRWPFGLGAFASLSAGFLIRWLKRPEGFINEDD